MLVSGVAGTFLYVKFKSRNITAHNKMVEAHNLKVAQNNQTVEQRRTDLSKEYFRLQNELLERTSAWYPPDYYNLEAVAFFIHAIRNGKATTRAEMVNLFDETQHRKEMLEHQRYQSQRLNDLVQSQQAIATQMRYSNMINAINSIQLMGINSNIRANTQAVNNLHNTVRL